MEIAYNFISLVSLGNFNPAIASPEFLKNVCGLELGELINQSPSIIPVHKNLQFQNLEIIVDMERMQIMEKSIENIEGSKILKIFNAYYEKLSYTPLKAVGININCELISQDEHEWNHILTKVSNPKTYFTFFAITEMRVTEDSSINADGSKWISLKYLMQNIRGLTRNISISKKKESLTLNYNFEVGHLSEDSSKLELLIHGYEDLCDEFSRFLKYLEN